MGIFVIILSSTGMYYYLHKKTRISRRYMLIDNPAVIAAAGGLYFYLGRAAALPEPAALLSGLAVIPLAGLALTLMRFYRKPNRIPDAPEDTILSPADGNVIYVKKCNPFTDPEHEKNRIPAYLFEYRNSGMLDTEYWHIGINMTPFDVHRNAAPISGTITMLEHFNGEFLSLKDSQALDRNERNSFLIINGTVRVGVVQIASRMVRRIVSYVKLGETVRKGDWLGMITFGSQVDVLVPGEFIVNIEVGEQVYANLTVIAKPAEDEDAD